MEKRISKTELREKIFQIFFASQFNKMDSETLEEFLNENNVLNKDDVNYVNKILDLKYENEEKLEKTIKKYLKENWEYSRIGKIKIAAIELAIIEIENGLPYKIAINEIVKIVKIYEDEKAAKFVNGILASYVRENNLDK